MAERSTQRLRGHELGQEELVGLALACQRSDIAHGLAHMLVLVLGQCYVHSRQSRLGVFQQRDDPPALNESIGREDQGMPAQSRVHAVQPIIGQTEAPSFSFGLEQHVLSGKIDLVRYAGEGYEIVDFKVGKSVPAALEQVDTQLDLYALGVESNLGLRVVRQTVHFLEDDKVYSLDWSSHRTESSRTRLTEMLSRIARREFPPRQD